MKKTKVIKVKKVSKVDKPIEDPVVSNKNDYIATVAIMGKRYKSSGADVSVAIGGLQPKNCKGRAILTLEHNGIKKDRIIMPVLAFRLFNTQGLSREIALKNISTLFQGI
ncbi:MAG: hypothetical protein V4469_04420 [Patescibacteria group bacterium]